MNEREDARTLDALLYMDRMSVRLYDEAIAKVDDETSATLTQFRDDHQRHEQQLGDAARRAGRQPEDPGEDVRMLVEEHARLLRAAQGQPAVIETLLVAERAMNALYDAYETLHAGGAAAGMLAQMHEDERRHVAFIQQRAPELATVMAGAGPGGGHEISCMTGGMTDDRNPDDFE